MNPVNYKYVAVWKIDVSKGTDINSTSALKESMLWHYWHFNDVGYKFESNVCNKCSDVLMNAYELKNHCNIICEKSWL